MHQCLGGSQRESPTLSVQYLLHHKEALTKKNELCAQLPSRLVADAGLCIPVVKKASLKQPGCNLGSPQPDKLYKTLYETKLFSCNELKVLDSHI